MSRVRRALWVPAALAVVRARARPGRWLPAASGVAVAIALLGAVAGLGVLTADRAAHRALGAVPPDRRAVALTWTGAVPAAVDRRARAALARMTRPGAAQRAVPQTRSVLRRPTRLAGRSVRLAAVRPLGRWVRLASGRLPRGCGPARCEVVALGGSAVPAELAGRGVRLVVVGRGRLTSAVPLGFVPPPVRPGGPTGARAPAALLATADPARLDAVPGLRAVPRIQGWSARLDLRGLRSWELGPTARRIQRVGAAAALRDRGLTTGAPLDALARAQVRAAEVPGRLVLAALPALAAVAGFLGLAAGGLRAGLRAELDRLGRRGATRGQRAVLAAAECGVPVLAGTLAGALAAAGIVAAAGAAGPAGAGPALVHGLWRAEVGLGAAACAAGALALLAAGSCAGRAAALRLTDLALAGALAGVAALALTPRAWGPGGSGASRVLLALGVALVAGLVAGRLAPAVLRLAGRRAPAGGRAPLRLALLDAARRPGPAALAAGALTVAVGFAVFAAAARDTLARGARDQAAFAVPLDATVAPGPALAGPLAGRDLRAWRALPGVAGVAPVLRRDADAVQGPSRQPVTLLGVPADRLGALGGTLGARAARLAPAPRGGGGRAAPLPPGARTVRVRARAAGAAVELALAVRRADGLTTTVPLGRAGAAPRVLGARLAPAMAGGAVSAVVVGRPAGAAATAAHQAAEDGATTPAGGAVLELGPLRDERGRTLTDLAGWRGHGAVGASRAAAAGTGRGRTARIAFEPRGDRGLLRPPAAIDRAPLAVLADPATTRDAGAGGTVEIAVAGTSVPARVVGTAARVPTIPSGGFVVADHGALAAALDALRPGAGAARELWVQAAPGTRPRALRRTLASGGQVAVRTRAAVRAGLRADPVRRDLGRVLVAAALVGVALALLGLGLAVRRLVRDGAAELADLEADGTPPSVLRRVVALQGAAMGALGLAGGAALGAILAALAPGVVRAAVGGPAPVPPLQAGLPGPALAALAACVVAAAALQVVVLARRGFRGAWPARPPAGEGA